jgi:regulator of RNase E activity RraB
LNLTRSDPVTRDHINAVVADLVELAEKFGGDYDGWGL